MNYRKATKEDMAQVLTLMKEYVASLSIDLSFQHIENELETLPGKYAEPEGTLFIAVEDDKICGCVALRKIDDAICEMKRLYVKDTYKGKGIGKELVRRIIEEGKAKGYRKMRLDTLSTMKKAQELYRKYGFHEIEAYVYNPIAGTVFMEKEL